MNCRYIMEETRRLSSKIKCLSDELKDATNHVTKLRKLINMAELDLKRATEVRVRDEINKFSVEIGGKVSKITMIHGDITLIKIRITTHSLEYASGCWYLIPVEDDEHYSPTYVLTDPKRLGYTACLKDMWENQQCFGHMDKLIEFSREYLPKVEIASIERCASYNYYIRNKA